MGWSMLGVKVVLIVYTYEPDLGYYYLSFGTFDSFLAGLVKIKCQCMFDAALNLWEIKLNFYFLYFLLF